ncbi:uncharacterized protein LOC141858447 [Brevipalpus obovatus]|uniref:uncharacterized protein LOC141858447 n=1 Tax=Brevipalpus obovatus TaxID=246614 RepID=UPI003D9EDA3C
MASVTENYANGFQLSFSENLEGNIMLENLRHQREQGKFCDIVLVVGSTRFPAHRSVLAASSPYFDSMFKNQPNKEEIDLPCQDRGSFSLLLDYVYSGKIVITDKNVNELLKLATNFALSKLKEYCEKYSSEKAKKSSSTTHTSPSSQSNFDSNPSSVSSQPLAALRTILEKKLNFPDINKGISFDSPPGDAPTNTTSTSVNNSNSLNSSSSLNTSSSKGPAPNAPIKSLTLSRTAASSGAPPLPTQPPSVRRSNSQASSNRQMGSHNRTISKPVPPSNKPIPPPKAGNNCSNGYPQQLSPNRQSDSINRRQSFNTVDQSRKNSINEGKMNSHLHQSQGNHSNNGSIPPPPPPPPSMMLDQAWGPAPTPVKSRESSTTVSNNRNGSISNDLSSAIQRSFVHSQATMMNISKESNIGPNPVPSLSNSNRSISKSSQSITGRPSAVPPPPPNRVIRHGDTNSSSSISSDTGTLRSNQSRGAAPLPPAPAPPPSQTNLQVQVSTNFRGPDAPNRQGSFSSNSSKSQAPTPPVRNISISRGDLESRFRNVFKDISQLPPPESFRAMKKTYPSDNGVKKSFKRTIVTQR